MLKPIYNLTFARIFIIQNIIIKYFNQKIDTLTMPQNLSIEFIPICININKGLNIWNTQYVNSLILAKRDYIRHLSPL